MGIRDYYEFIFTAAENTDKLNMTIDSDIFRGGIPANVNGCGVELVGYEEDDLVSSARYFISFFCIDASRNKVMENIKSLADKFPSYGETVTVEGAETVIRAITKTRVKFSKETTDNGKIKSFGELLLKVSI